MRQSRRYHSLVSPRELESVAKFISSASRLCILTGAGISTGSGIPDYRGPNGSYKHGHVPMQENAFTTTNEARQRYWARSFAAYPTFRNAKPNAAHFGVASLLQKGFAHGVITQNVDLLHEAAGVSSPLHLHGTLRTATCLTCGAEHCRDALQATMTSLNSSLDANALFFDELRPDGDAPISDEVIQQFEVPVCPCCGGVLKPSVVFFGGTIPPSVKEAAHDMVLRSDKLLVVGSSLEVFSAYRLVSLASERGIPVSIINSGITRAERMGLNVETKANSDCAELLSAVQRML